MSLLCSKTFYGAPLPIKQNSNFIDWYGMPCTTCLKSTFPSPFRAFHFKLSLHLPPSWGPSTSIPAPICHLNLWSAFNTFSFYKLGSFLQPQNHLNHVWFFFSVGGKMTSAADDFHRSSAVLLFSERWNALHLPCLWFIFQQVVSVLI